MNSWSARRKRIIFLLTLLCLVVLIGVPMFFFLYKTPTCTDGTMNGDETGVDCGGSCKLICTAQSLPMLTKGDPRVLKVATSTFETVVVVQNPNVSASVVRASYVFKLFTGSSTVPIKIIEGKTFIPRGSSFALFEGPFLSQDAELVRASFEWKSETLQWENDSSIAPNLLIENTILTNASSTPKLEATVKNNSFAGVSNIELVALISDENANIIAASKTFVENLGISEKTPIIFTWPTPFIGTSTAVEIIPRILPDQSYIR